MSSCATISFVVDGRILTCAGATAALDMMLQLIQCHHGRRTRPPDRRPVPAWRHPRATEGQRQVLLGAAVRNTVVQRAVQRMEATVEEPVSPAKLAHELGVSQRQLERLSKRYLGCTPAKFHAQLRLQRARRMLRQTELTWRRSPSPAALSRFPISPRPIAGSSVSARARIGKRPDSCC